MPSAFGSLHRGSTARCGEVADHSPNLDSCRIAILAALNLANESSSSEDAEDGRFVEMVERVSSLTSDLEAALDS